MWVGPKAWLRGWGVAVWVGLKAWGGGWVWLCGWGVVVWVGVKVGGEVGVWRWAEPYTTALAGRAWVLNGWRAVDWGEEGLERKTAL